jgi:hypothetical protein
VSEFGSWHVNLRISPLQSQSYDNQSIQNGVEMITMRETLSCGSCRYARDFFQCRECPMSRPHFLAQIAANLNASIFLSHIMLGDFFPISQKLDIASGIQNGGNSQTVQVFSTMQAFVWVRHKSQVRTSQINVGIIMSTFCLPYHRHQYCCHRCKRKPGLGTISHPGYFPVIDHFNSHPQRQKLFPNLVSRTDFGQTTPPPLGPQPCL